MYEDITHMPSTSSSAWSTTSRSLLNRLSLLKVLRSRSRNLTDFYIRPDEPYRKYSPGDTVKGTVVLTVIKQIRITHLTVCLHGFLRVFKSLNHVNDLFANPSLPKSQKSHKSQCVGNGHASLFQDEVTLCGEGRLDAGIYEFEFELVFPSNGLPTSIDFERGTISYLITATVTRPTSVNATSSCNQKISLVETVDIGAMLPPKPRTISLTSITHKPKRKRASQRNRQQNENLHEQDSKFESETSFVGAQPEDVKEFCRSMGDAQSSERKLKSSENQGIDVTNSSTNTEGNGSSQEFSSETSWSGSTSSVPKDRVSKRLMKDQTIMATIELLKSGCLPGDNLPVKITIKHRKPLRSMHGAIITFYRQGRIDSTPCHMWATQVSEKEAARCKHEEYYPKSKTGLGGLSLTSAGPSGIFRKDLAQTFAPIVIDPITLTAVINTSVRIPEDIFPTIKDVPGQMIMFKYKIEVVLDLNDKLTGLQRHMPVLGALAGTCPKNYGNLVGTCADQNLNSIFTALGGCVIGTDAIRRQKNVVASTFEVTIGSEDSFRGRTRKIANYYTPNIVAEENRRQERLMIMTHPLTKNRQPSKASPRLMEIREELEDRESIVDHNFCYEDENSSQYLELSPCEDCNHNYFHNSLDHPTPVQNPSTSIQPPKISTDEELSEKERIKRAEERLLPGSPPIENESSFSLAYIPTVPPCIPEDKIDNYYDLTSDVPPTNFQALGNFLAPTSSSQRVHHDSVLNSSEQSLGAGDDKQELERQRLLANVSSPFTAKKSSPNVTRNGERSGDSSFIGGVDMENYSISPELHVEEDEPQNYYFCTDISSHHGYNCESPPRYEK